MGARYEWADERHIIMNVYLEAPWTWADYHAMMASMLPILRDLKKPCATVVDCSKMGALPRDGNVLHILMNVEKNMPPNLFASVVVAAPHMVSVFMNILTNIRPRAKVLAMFTPTMEEAHEKIYARYEQLSADLAKG